MNWYVLYSLSYKTKQLVKRLNYKDSIYAFIPSIEYYRRDIDDYAIKPLFPGYIFIKSDLKQREFDLLLMNMREEKDGLIRELQYKDDDYENSVSALTNEEQNMFNKLLDISGVLRMSQASLVNNKAVVLNGPLMSFQGNIVKLDKRNKLAYLNLTFMDRDILAGLEIIGKYYV